MHFKNCDDFIMKALGLEAEEGEAPPFCAPLIQEGGKDIPIGEGVDLVLRTIFPSTLESLLRLRFGLDEGGRKRKRPERARIVGGSVHTIGSREERALYMIRNHPVRRGWLARFLRTEPSGVSYEYISYQRVLELVELYNAIRAVSGQYGHVQFSSVVGHINLNHLESSHIIELPISDRYVSGIGPKSKLVVQEIAKALRRQTIQRP